MTLSVHGLADALQTLLSDTAEEAARASGFLKRCRKISGAGFVQSLVLGWLGDPEATLDDLAGPLGVTAQALHQRFTPRAVDCLQRVLRRAMDHLFGARPEAIPLLRRFTEVVLEDSTTIALPARLAPTYPGCGGSDPQAGRAGLKVLVQFEALTGRLRLAEPAPARDSDRALHAALPPPPRGSLRLVDLGFFDLTRMARDMEHGISWISRVPARLTVRGGDGEGPGLNVAQWLARQGSDRIDTPVTLGTRTRLRCRLVAVRTPKALAEARLERLRKAMTKKGRKLSEAQRVLCQWTVMVTDLGDAQRFPAEALWVLYRVRWQVELLFKRWKSGAGVGGSRGRTDSRVLCECLAKLLAAVIAHWGTLLRGGPLHAISATRAGRRVRRWAERLAEALAVKTRDAVATVLGRMKADLDRLPKRPRRRARPSTRQLLFAPRFVH